MARSVSGWSPRALAALRIVAGLLFLAHGVVKLFGFPEGAQPGEVEIASLMGVGAIIELVTGALLVLGLFTRPAAFIASGQMAVAYWMFHFPSSPYPAANGGAAGILVCFVFLLLFTFAFLYICGAGPGAWSLDKG